MRDVNEILKGSEAASPGPVKVWYHAVVAQIEDAMGDGGDVIVAECEQGIEVCHRWKANAEFVANAWTDVPEMAAEIIRLRARVEKLGTALIITAEFSAKALESVADSLEKSSR